MNKNDLQNYIETNIPIIKSLKFSISEINGNNIVVEAPFKEHINHTNSAFGGSISSLMTLAGWAKAKVIMESIDNKATIVIQESNVKFIKPVLDDFIAYTDTEDITDMVKFENMYKKHGKTRINIKVFLKEKNKNNILASFEGMFVIIKKS